MTVFFCLDDKNGIMFNNRRQSRDASVIERIMDIVCEEKLYVSNYSAALFEENRIIITDNITNNCKFYFAENIPVNNIVEDIDKIIIYRWNRIYPSDVKLDIELSAWKKISGINFTGKSHEKITEEVYVK